MSIGWDSTTMVMRKQISKYYMACHILVFGWIEEGEWFLDGSSSKKNPS
jgi:hypothetical protein